MPVAVDPDPDVVPALLAALPPGSHGVESIDRLQAWLGTHAEDYLVVLGPTLTIEESLAACAQLRVSRPTLSVVLAREELGAELLTAALKSGARDVVRHEDLASLEAAVTRAYELYVALRGPTGATHHGRVVSIFSPKGGVGKTTVAVNLALALSDKGARRVCLVDLDLAFGDVAITMQLFPSHTLEHAVGSEDSLDVEQLDALLTRHQDSLMVLAAPAHPDTRERVTPQLVSRLLRTVRETFDFVVVDLAPSLDEQVLTALDETDELVLITTLDVPTLKNVKVAVDTFDTLHLGEGHRHLVLNRADDDVGLSADKVEGILSMPIAVQVPTSMEIAAATNAGRPLVDTFPGHPLSVGIRELASGLAGEPVAPRSVTAAVPDARQRGRRGRRGQNWRSK